MASLFPSGEAPIHSIHLKERAVNGQRPCFEIPAQFYSVFTPATQTSYVHLSIVNILCTDLNSNYTRFPDTCSRTIVRIAIVMSVKTAEHSFQEPMPNSR